MKVADLFALLSIKTDEASLKKADKVLSNVGGQLKRLTLAAGAAVVGMGALVTQTASAADNYSKFSRKVGISVEKLQQLEFAAQLSGSNMDVVRTALQRFARTADDAGQGMESAKEPFQRLGLDIKGASGELKDLDTLLLEAADSFRAMPDGTEKTALAMKTFGRAGAELIPLLNEGSAGIEKLRKEFAETGAQISTEDAQAFEEYNDTLLRVKTALVGFRNQAVVALLPYLKQISKLMLEWVKANKAMLKQKLTAVFSALLKVMKAVAKIVVFMIKHIRILTIAFVSWKLAIIAVALAQKVMAAGGVLAAAKIAVAWAAAALPFVLIATIIAAIILLLEDLYYAFTGGDSVLKGVWDEIVAAWSKPLEAFFSWVEKAIDDLVVKADDLISLVTGRESKREKREKARVEGFVRSFGEGGRVAQAKRSRVDAGKSYSQILAEEEALGVGGPVFGPAAQPTKSDFIPLSAYGAAGAANQFGDVHIQIDGSKDPEATGRAVREALADEARSIKRPTP